MYTRRRTFGAEPGMALEGHKKGKQQPAQELATQWLRCLFLLHMAEPKCGDVCKRPSKSHGLEACTHVAAHSELNLGWHLRGTKKVSSNLWHYNNAVDTTFLFAVHG